MDMLLPALWWLLAFLLVVVGLVGTVAPLLPGPPLVLAGLWLAAWIDGFTRVGSATLWLLAILCGLALLLDFIASALGAQRARASRQAIWGAIGGSLIGMFFGLPGLILGPFAGAVIGELHARRLGPRGTGTRPGLANDVTRATEVGIATWIGLLLGIVAKLVICLVMLFIFVFVWLI